MAKNKKAGLSIIIPARDEEQNITRCVSGLVAELKKVRGFSYEIIIVDNNSTDKTQQKINGLKKRHPLVVKGVFEPEAGFGNAVRAGLNVMSGEYFCLVMADYSDDPRDLAGMMRLLKRHSYDVIHTNRFSKKGLVKDYPRMKLLFNRLGNNMVSLLYMTKLNDLTNAFRIMKSSLLKNYELRSDGFSLTIELSLLALVKAKSFYEYDVRWYNRKKGKAHMKLHKVLPQYMKVIMHFLPYRYGLRSFK